MKIVEINSMVYGSTGTIVHELNKIGTEKGHEFLMLFPKSRTNIRRKKECDSFYGSILLRYIGDRLSYFTGYSNCFCIINTFLLICKIKKFSPDIIHLHNLHPNYINIPLLFSYIKKNNIPVVWTLHDCWAFTGGCPHFVYQKCDKWKKQCDRCTIFQEYPGSWKDNTKQMYKLKKKWITSLNRLTFVVPSQWLADCVKQSYLRYYPIKVIHNGVDINVFKIRKNHIHEKFHIEGKKIILGVASGWSLKKGLDVFNILSDRLDSSYQIILVGTDDVVDKSLSPQIISIHRTENKVELSELYSAASVFVNPTREDTYPTTNMESIACGTPVITFKTGGSPESIDKYTGSVVDLDDIESIINEIKKLSFPQPSDKFIGKAIREFDEKLSIEEYFKTFKSLSLEYCL